MFDSLVVTKTQKRGARALLGFPAALTLHAVLGMGFLLFSLYSPVALPAPPFRGILWERPAIPVTLVKPAEVKIADPRNGRDARSSDGGIKAPREIPDSIPTSPPEGPPTGSTGTDDSGFLPTDPSDPSDNTQPIAAPPTVPIWTLVETPRLLVQVRPEYPRALEAMRVSGKVVLDVVVDETGAVTAVTVLSSPNPLFSRAAEEAVRQWKYSRPVPPGGGMARVVMKVVVDFKF